MPILSGYFRWGFLIKINKMDLELKKRVDDGEIIVYYNGVDFVEIEKAGKKYFLFYNTKIKKANYSFNVISKELELLNSVHNFKEI